MASANDAHVIVRVKSGTFVGTANTPTSDVKNARLFTYSEAYKWTEEYLGEFRVAPLSEFWKGEQDDAGAPMEMD